LRKKVEYSLKESRCFAASPNRIADVNRFQSPTGMVSSDDARSALTVQRFPEPDCEQARIVHHAGSRIRARALESLADQGAS
jgi:hypothetical protein